MAKSNKLNFDKKFIKILQKYNLHKNDKKKNLFFLGILDSLNFIRLISDIEKNFRIKFSSNEISNNNLGKINFLKNKIKKKLRI